MTLSKLLRWSSSKFFLLNNEGLYVTPCAQTKPHLVFGVEASPERIEYLVDPYFWFLNNELDFHVAPNTWDINILVRGIFLEKNFNVYPGIENHSFVQWVKSVTAIKCWKTFPWWTKKKKMSQLIYRWSFFVWWAKIALRSGAKIQFFDWGTKTLEM